MSVHGSRTAFAAALVAALAAAPLAAQEAPDARSGAAVGITGLLDAAAGAPIPRTPWDAPDLRGVWNNSNKTPLERRTEAEIERGQLAQQAVIEATRGPAQDGSSRSPTPTVKPWSSTRRTGGYPNCCRRRSSG